MLTDCVYKHVLQPTSTTSTIAVKDEYGKWTSKVLAAALSSLVPPPVYFVMEHSQRMLPQEALLLLVFYSLRHQAPKDERSVEVVS